MTNDRVELRSLRVAGRVGVLPFEQNQDQPLEVDIDVERDLSTAGVSDQLEDTIDYGELCELVEQTVRDRPSRLLEHLAERIAGAVLAVDPQVGGTVVSVRKLRPPVPQDLHTAGVRIRRQRG